MKPAKITYLLAISLSLLAINHCAAQAFTVIKATSQFWAGGVVGNYGANYTFELEPSSKKIVPDTVWINGAVFPIDFSKKDGRTTSSIDSVTHKLKYTIIETDFHTNYKNMHLPNQPPDTTATQKPMHVRQFEGAAMFSYMLKHKQHFFIVKSLTRLRQVNYP